MNESSRRLSVWGRSADRGLRRTDWLVLVIGFALTIGTFVATMIVAELSERGIYQSARRISTQLSPLASRLASLQSSVRQLKSDVEHAAEPDVIGQGRPLALRGLEKPLARILDEWKAYVQMTAFETNSALRTELAGRVRALSDNMRRVKSAAVDGDAATRKLLEDGLTPALDDLDAAIERFRDDNVLDENSAAQDIVSQRERSVHVAAALGVASIALGSLSAVLAAVLVRKRERLLLRRAGELETFACRVAHDIRSPLAGVGLAFEAILRQVAADSSLLPTVDRGRRCSDRVVKTVEALLGFALANAAATPGKADTAEVIRDVVEDLRPTAEERNIELGMAPVARGVLACSPEILWTLLSNLIGNAIKFMGDRPVRRVTVGTEAVGGHRMRVAIKDTGPGVPRDELTRIFEPYVRGSDASAPGIGLGLATVQRLVAGHGGTVGVASAAGRGSTFWFELPAQLEPEAKRGPGDAGRDPAAAVERGPVIRTAWADAEARHGRWPPHR